MGWRDHVNYSAEISGVGAVQPYGVRAAVCAIGGRDGLDCRRASTPPVAWRWQELVGIVLCMATARSAAMAFNRLADRRIDAENPRTQMRHLPAGLLSGGNVTSVCPELFGRVHRVDAVVPAELVAGISGRAGAVFLARVQFYKTVHGAVAFLARRG